MIANNLVNLSKLTFVNFNQSNQLGGDNTNTDSESDRNPDKILPFLDDDKINIKNKNLCIKKSFIDIAGLGVYTNRNFNINDIVEISPVLRVQSDFLFQDGNILNDYIFRDPYDNTHKLVALGFGSMYNHSDDPNLRYFYQNGRMIYQAIKPIKKDDELYISYGTNWWHARNNKTKINH